MGNYIIKRNNYNQVPLLLQPALEGDIDKLKTLIGHFIATSEPSITNTTTSRSTHHSDKNPNHQPLAAFVNQSDHDGNTALHGAIFSGHLDIVQFLIQHCHADLYLKNTMGCSPFWIACGYGRVDILQYILSINKNSHVTSFDLSRACRQSNSTGDTPLIAAVYKGHDEIVEMILSAVLVESSPADAWDILTMTNKNGDTCLGLAVSMASDNDRSRRLIQILLDFEERLANEYCVDGRRPLHCKSVLGLTPLLVACERDNLNLVQVLVSKGADIHTTDKDGRSPLAIASFCGCLEVLDYFLGMDDISSFINRQDSNGCTPLWLAARTGNVKVVRKLMHAGADATIQNNAGLSSMDVAEKFQKQQVVDFFQQESSL